MAKVSNKIKTRLKIVGATFTTIFTLATVFTATLAWFVAQGSIEASGMAVKVAVSGSANLRGVNLIKFNYHSETIGGFEVIDYLDPSTGEVGKYYFNSRYDSGAGSFGYDDNDTFVPVDTIMNVYDPVDRIIRGGNLHSMNCNAIYEVTFESTSETSYLQLYSDLVERIPGSNQILLSDCVDIDLYFEDNLLEVENTYSSESTYSVNDLVVYDGVLRQCNTAIGSAEDYTAAKWTEVGIYSKTASYTIGQAVFYNNAIYTCTANVDSESFSANKWSKYNTYSNSSTYAVGDVVFYNGLVYQCVTAIGSAESFNASKWKAALCDKIYYPSYKSANLNATDKLYYKISFLSSLETNHNNFYGTNPKPSQIEVERDHLVEFYGEEVKVYINMNYAPSKADVYMKEIYNQIRAIYDFTFDFQFSKTPEVGA